MKNSVSWFGIGIAIVTIAACAHRAGPITSGITDDSPRTVSGERVGTQNPGSEGPVSDYSRLAINHPDVAAREARERARLARHNARYAPDSTIVTDNTTMNSSAPVVSEPATKNLVTKKHHKAKKKVAQVYRDHTRMHAAAPAAMMAPAPEAVLMMKREVVLNQLHHVNQKEINLAKLAGDRATSSDVKTAAERIQGDHRRLDAEVRDLAKRRGVTLAKFQNSDYEGVAMDKMKALSGRNFDYAYAQEMKDGHRFTAAELRVLRNRVGDPEIISLIDQTLPVITRHEMRSRNALGAINTNKDYSAQSR